MANKVVKVNYTELESIASNTLLTNESLEPYIDQLFSEIIGNTDAWESKFQKAFDKHVQSETVIYLKKVFSDLKKYSSYLDRTVENYKKIDVYR